MDKKKIILIGLVIVMLVVFYNVFIKSSNKSAKVVTQGSAFDTISIDQLSEEEQRVGGEFLDQLLNLEAMTLPGDIFDNPSFGSLSDFTIDLIQPGNEGRPNPFAPVGEDVAFATPGAPVQTGQVTKITNTSATLSGILANGLSVTERFFEYGTTESLGSTTTKITSTLTPFETNLTSMTPGTTYYFRAVAKIGSAYSFGDISSFQTTGTAPVTNTTSSQSLGGN